MLSSQDGSLIQELPLYSQSYRKRFIIWNVLRMLLGCTMLGSGIYLSIDHTYLVYLWLPFILFSCCICGYMLICTSGIWCGLNHETLVLDGTTYEIYSKKSYTFHTIKYPLMHFEEFLNAKTATDNGCCGSRKYGRLHAKSGWNRLGTTARFSEPFAKKKDVKFLRQTVQNINNYFHRYDRMRCDFLISGLSKDTYNKRRVIPFEIIDLIVDFVWPRIEE